LAKKKTAKKKKAEKQASPRKRKLRARKAVPGDKDPKSGRFRKGNRCGHRQKKGDPPLNPHGRPKGPDVIATLRKVLQEEFFDYDPETGKYSLPTGKSGVEVLVERILLYAASGNFKFAELIVDRLHGKVPIDVRQQLSTLHELSDEELKRIAEGKS
jgi:hypothetical protein